jgi:hypothetical protein
MLRGLNGIADCPDEPSDDPGLLSKELNKPIDPDPKGESDDPSEKGDPPEKIESKGEDDDEPNNPFIPEPRSKGLPPPAPPDSRINLP